MQSRTNWARQDGRIKGLAGERRVHELLRERDVSASARKPETTAAGLGIGFAVGDVEPPCALDFCLDGAPREKEKFDVACFGAGRPQLL